MYFLFFLLGAHVGKLELHHKREYKAPVVSIQLVASIVLFYGIQWVCDNYPSTEWMQIVSLLPLLGVCLSMYRFTETQFMLSIYANKYCGWMIGVIGGLCLEIYLVQAWVRTTALNHLFPLNLLILFILIVLAAYVCRSMGRFLQQTLSSEDGYRWQEIFGLRR